MLPINQEMYSELRDAHERLYLYLKTHRQNINGAALSLQESVDLAYTLREVADLAKDMEKEIRKVFETLEKQVCTQATKLAIQNGTMISDIETEYCKATPDCKEIQVIPRYSDTIDSEREKYYQLLQWLGIDEQLWDRGTELYAEGEIDTKVVDIHWPGLQGYLQRLKAAGHPLPDFFDASKVYQKFKLHIRKRKGIID